MANWILSVDAARPMLRVVFDRVEDRFAHRIEWCDGSGDGRTVLASIEGTSDDTWPPSPVVQEVHFEDRSDGSRVALGVGRAGKSHWSLSISLAADGRSLLMQSACRVRASPVALGSVYEVGDKNSMDHLRIAPASNASLRNEPGRVCILPGAHAQELPDTIMWDFALERTSP